MGFIGIPDDVNSSTIGMKQLFDPCSSAMQMSVMMVVSRSRTGGSLGAISQRGWCRAHRDSEAMHGNCILLEQSLGLSLALTHTWVLRGIQIHRKGRGVCHRSVACRYRSVWKLDWLFQNIIGE